MNGRSPYEECRQSGIPRLRKASETRLTFARNRHVVAYVGRLLVKQSKKKQKMGGGTGSLDWAYLLGLVRMSVASWAKIDSTLKSMRRAPRSSRPRHISRNH